MDENPSTSPPAPRPSTRTGKIARLPRHIRDQLNQRLDDGQEARQLAPWLNSLPEVQAVLAANFSGQPINEMNLTNWKQGGFLDWQNLNQERDWLNQLAEDAADLHSAAGNAFAENLALVLTADLAFTARSLLDSAAGPQDRWQCLRQFLPELARLRHGDHRSQLLELSRRRSNRLEAEARASQAESRERARLTTRAREQLISDLFASPDPSLKALAAELAQSPVSASRQSSGDIALKALAVDLAQNPLAAQDAAAPPLGPRPSALDTRPSPQTGIARSTLINPNKA
jgi:hypothetical protein